MVQDANLFYKQAFGTLGSEPRYFLAGYVLGDEPLSRKEIDLRIEEKYPALYSSFFLRQGYYAFKICERALSSLGLAKNVGKVLHHPTRGAEDVSTYAATDLVNKLQKIVHFWWKSQLEHNVHASGYIALLSGPTLDAPFNRAKLIHQLSEHDSVALEEIADNTGLRYEKLYRHMAALESLGAVKIETPKRQWGKYRSSRVHVMDGLRLIEEIFLSPAFEEISDRNSPHEKDAPQSFDEYDLFELLRMHYFSKSNAK